MSSPLEKLDVFLDRGPGRRKLVGQLAYRRGRCYFEYAAEFLAAPQWLSPFKLPPKPGLWTHQDFEFGPIFGLFDDSLPDGWGLLLMNRYFAQRGRQPAELTPLERLAWLGDRTMGALTYHPPASEPVDAAVLDLATLARAAAQVREGKVEELLPQLVRAGGSPGGARPKVLVGLREDVLVAGDGQLPAGFVAWLVKFPAAADDGEAGAVEAVYAEVARRAGITLAPTRLFETPAGRFFGTQRFDRAEGGRRFHVHSFGNLIHANFRIPSCDYRQLLEITRILTRRPEAVAEVFRRMVFNIAMCNRDDHVKNFAFLLDDADEWQLTPAFDLTFSRGPGGEHSMTVAGEGRAPGRQHVLALAEAAAIPREEVELIFEQVAAASESWRELARESSISEATIDQIDVALAQQRSRLAR